MQGIKKLLVLGMLMPLLNAPLQAKPDDSEKIKINGKKDLAIAVGSLITCAYLGGLALKKAGITFDEWFKKCTKKPKTKEGKELMSACSKGALAIAGAVGAWGAGRLLKKAYEKAHIGDTTKFPHVAPVFNQL